MYRCREQFYKHITGVGWNFTGVGGTFQRIGFHFAGQALLLHGGEVSSPLRKTVLGELRGQGLPPPPPRRVGSRVHPLLDPPTPI